MINGIVINVYDNQGQLLSTTLPDGSTTSTSYEAEGRRISSTDQLGHTTMFQYDQLGRLKKTIAADGSFTTTNYDIVGRVSSTTDALGHTTSYEYDPNCGCSGRQSKITDALGNITSKTYDQNGNQTSITDARGNTTQFIYDLLNRQTRVIFPDNTSQQTVYDTLGQRIAQTDQDGKTTQYFYDKLGRLVKVKDALNQETQYSYDELGEQLSQVDALGRTTRYEYDNVGRRTKRILPLGQSESYGYNQIGNLTSHRDFNNKVTTFSYDALNRQLAKAPDASFNQAPITYTYNTLGLRSSMTDLSGTTTYAYDNRNRLIQVVTPEGTLTYSYDLAGNLLNIASSSPNGLSTEFGYDLLNRLKQVNDHNLAASNNLTQYSYDQVGNLATVALPNTVTTSYQYNSLNRLTNLASILGSNTISSYIYQLGNAGNRTSVTELSGRVANYTYDAIYRLTNETISGASIATQNGSISYTYDPVGNRLSRSSSLAAVATQQNISVDNNDRLTSDSYDNNGNTVAADGRSYSYDFENRIVAVTGPNLSISIVYNGDGDRVQKTVNGVTTKYLVDRNNLTGYAQVVEEIQNDQVIRQYTYGLDLISERQLINGAYQTSFYGYDGHGSVRYLTDANGNVTDTYDYDAFGVLINQTGSTPNNYLYAGEQYDADLGLYYNRARYLEVNRGRFWSQDSFEGDQEIVLSLHKYSYVGNSPIDKIDPSGQFSTIDIGISTLINAPVRNAATLQVAAILSQIIFYGSLVALGVVTVNAVGAFSTLPTPPDTSVSNRRDEPAVQFLYAFGNASGPSDPRIESYNTKPGQKPDLSLSVDGLVGPEYDSEGFPKGKSTYADPNIAPVTGAIWRASIVDILLTEGLGVVRDDLLVGGKQPLGHHTIFPTRKMPPQEFINKIKFLQQSGDTVKLPDGSTTKIGWVKTGKKMQ